MLRMIVLSSCCCFLGGLKYFEETMTQTMPFSLQSDLFMSNRNGKIIINSWDRNEIKVDATKRGRGYTKEETKRILEEVRINISKDEEGVRIETDSPDIINRDISVNYNILVPKEANLVIESKNGGSGYEI